MEKKVYRFTLAKGTLSDEKETHVEIALTDEQLKQQMARYCDLGWAFICEEKIVTYRNVGSYEILGL